MHRESRRHREKKTHGSMRGMSSLELHMEGDAVGGE